jgi:cell division protein ZapA (FtsZ GTPase activity inhibitor)
VTSQTKAIILAAFNIANELFQIKEEKEDFSKRLDSLLEIADQAQALEPPQPSPSSEAP